MRIKRSPKVIAGAAVVGLIAAGGAFAFWTADGTGIGSAATATTVPLIVTQTASLEKLTPGGPAVPLHGVVENPNQSAIHINEMTVTVGNMPGTGCLPQDFVISGVVAPFDLIASPPNSWIASGTWSGMSIQLTNTGVNQDGCKGLAVPLVFATN